MGCRTDETVDIYKVLVGQAWYRGSCVEGLLSFCGVDMRKHSHERGNLLWMGILELTLGIFLSSDQSSVQDLGLAGKWGPQGLKGVSPVGKPDLVCPWEQTGHCALTTVLAPAGNQADSGGWGVG